MTDWLDLCRAAVADVDGVLERLPTRVEREPVVGAGLGGDETTAIDQAAEEVILARVREAAGAVVSEEIGRIGEGLPLVVVDPIDGSLNAKRRLRPYSLSIAVASGETMRDVAFGYVADLSSRDEWWAALGRGACFRDEPLAVPADPELEILGVESARPELVAAAGDALTATGARRLRMIGSIALSLCHVAAGRFDGLVSLRPCRSVDAAAGQLLVREAGGEVAFPDTADGELGASLTLAMRSRVVAAPSAAVMRQLGALASPVPG